MSSLKQVFALVAFAVLSYYAPGIGTAIASELGITSGFLTAVIGSVVLAAGTFAIQSLLLNGQRGTDMQAGKINIRVGEPTRWLCAGLCRQGGGVLFAEFDSNGNFWFIIVHSDSILQDAERQYFLDDIAVTLDGSGVVLNKEFRLKNNKTHDPAESDGEGTGYVQIWTTTYTETDPIPPNVAELTAALPQWTADEHLLVGTTYSVVKMRAIEIEDRYKIYKWRGGIGIGEPAISIAGMWSNMYDPRDVTQTLGDRTTYKPSTNSALIWAWFRTHRYGRGKSESSINWDEVSAAADICDETVTGLSGDTVRYRCGIAVPDDKQRIVAEQEIIFTMDAQLVFDDAGLVWASPGAYYAPTLVLTRNRDIIAMESVEAQNGESETQGVIVRYTDPAANYSAQPSAAWLNPLYYDPAQTPKFLTVTILGIFDHNQAMRVAKGIGLRSQPPHKIAPTVGLRGLRARQERIFNLVYDNTFAGDYEIATQVEVDQVGVICGFGAVPVDADRWNLLPGEEKPKPVVDGTSVSVVVPDAPTGVVLAYNNGQLEATFDAPARVDVRFQFQFIETANVGTDKWSDMTVEMDNLIAHAVPDEAVEYTVRWRSVTPGGTPSAWSDDTILVEFDLDFDGGDAYTEVG